MISQPLVTGSVIKIWQENRGHDYMVVGVKGRGAAKRLGLLRNTCVNNSGEIHAATNKIHKWVKVEHLDDLNMAVKVKRVEGTRSYTRDGIRSFVRNRIRDMGLRALKASDDIYPSLSAIDSRSSSIYL